MGSTVILLSNPRRAVYGITYVLLTILKFTVYKFIGISGKNNTDIDF